MSTPTTIAAALLAAASLTTADEPPGWLTVPDDLRTVIDVKTRTGDGGQYYVLEPVWAAGSCDGPARLNELAWVDQMITVTENAELPSLATGEPVTVEPGVYEARLCTPDYNAWGTVWVGDEPVNLDGTVAYYWTLPEGAAEALVWQSDLPRELTADAELRAQPSLDAPLTGTTIPAGSEVYSALALEDLDGQTGWIAMQAEDGTAGWAPHWSVDPGLGGWGPPAEALTDEPTVEGEVETAVDPEPTPFEDIVVETAEPEPEPTVVVEAVEQPAEDSNVPWLPVALGGGGALLLAGVLTGRGLRRKTRPEED